MKLLVNLWFTTKGFWYRGNQLREVDDRLMAIIPPTEISREIRSPKVIGKVHCILQFVTFSFRISVLFNVYSIPILPPLYYECLLLTRKICYN